MTSDPVEYPQGVDFPGVIGRTVQESSPAWPAPIRTRDGAPNVVFVVLDDVGYGRLSRGFDLGGELIADDESALRLLMAQQ
jgi:hypothetical protein